MSLELPLQPIDLPKLELERRFDALQKKLVPLWAALASLEDDGEQTIVVVPSLTVDYAALQGSLLQAYEERFLFLFLLLRQPNARLIYVSSQSIHPHIVDYYLGLLPGVITSHARSRLHLLAAHDGAPQPLSIKLLQRPRLLERIRQLVPNRDRAHLVPFNTTRYERDLAVRLGIPMYGADPRHHHLGTKSGARRLFASCGVPHPLGFEDLASQSDVVDAVAELAKKRPEASQAMVKLNDGVSGDGNAALSLSGLAPGSRSAVEERVRAMRLESKELSYDDFMAKLTELGGIVEERVTGSELRSPSAQLRVTPVGKVQLISTHDQLLGGNEGQTFLGCTFPAHRDYAAAIARESLKVAPRLIEEGVLGRFALDFVCAKHGDSWKPYAIEINLRKGGTTHPYLTLQFLTDGNYDADAAEFRTRAGESKHYVATDALVDRRYRAFSPDDVFDIAVRHALHFDPVRQTGVVFHMLSAIGDRGRLGLTAVENSLERAEELYDRTRRVLDEEADAALIHSPLGDR